MTIKNSQLASEGITDLVSGVNLPDGPEHSYMVFSSKLVKFRDTKLRAVKFSQSGSRGKLLITFDQRGIIRFHKIRGFKALLSYDFRVEWHRLDYIFTNHVETTRIELKHENQDKIPGGDKETMTPQPMHDSSDTQISG